MVENLGRGSPRIALHPHNLDKGFLLASPPSASFGYFLVSFLN